MYLCLEFAIIDGYVEAARKTDDELVQRLVCMCSAAFLGWNVVEIKHSLYFKRNVMILLDKSEIAARVRDLWKCDYFAIIDARFFLHFSYPHEKLL